MNASSAVYNDEKSDKLWYIIDGKAVSVDSKRTGAICGLTNFGNTIMPSTHENYASLCDAENSVLLIVDIQTRLTAAMPAKVLARLQRNTNLLINTANRLRIPVFVTEQYPEGLGNTEPEIQKTLSVDTNLYEKTCFSCAGADNFSEDLAATSRKQIILAGMEAHVCILQTAIDLLNQGYAVFVVADAVCSRHRENYETALRRLSKAGGSVCDAESVLFEWLRDAGHPHFKEVQSTLVPGF